MTNTLEAKITALSNKIKQLINVKANKANGVSEITDANSDDYTNIAIMQSGATQASINDSINIVLGNCVKTSLTSGLLKNDGTIDINSYAKTNDVVDNLTTNDTSKMLSAKQGKVLNEKIGDIDSYIESNHDLIYTSEIIDNVTNNDMRAVTSNAVYDAIENIDLTNYVQKSNTNGLIKNDGTIDTNSYLTSHQDISGKVDKVNGKGLSTNDFTNEYKTAIDNMTSSGGSSGDISSLETRISAIEDELEDIEEELLS